MPARTGSRRQEMLIRRPDDVASSEITPHGVWLDRRRFIETMAAGATSILLPGSAAGAQAQQDELTPWEDVTTYNNFYEFGTAKDDPAKNARNFRTRPWSVAVEG